MWVWEFVFVDACMSMRLLRWFNVHVGGDVMKLVDNVYIYLMQLHSLPYFYSGIEFLCGARIEATGNDVLFFVGLVSFKLEILSLGL